MAYPEFSAALASFATHAAVAPFTCPSGAVLPVALEHEIGHLLANGKLEMVFPAVDSVGMHDQRRPGVAIVRNSNGALV